jgi:uncharacterized small protein (DUF1192 family)
MKQLLSLYSRYFIHVNDLQRLSFLCRIYAKEKQPSERVLTMDDDLEALKPGQQPDEFERWNIEDLEAYKARLQAEIDAIDAVISGKSSVRDLAENLFKS